MIGVPLVEDGVSFLLNSVPLSLALSLLPQPMRVLGSSLGDLERVSSVALLPVTPEPTHIHEWLPNAVESTPISLTHALARTASSHTHT